MATNPPLDLRLTPVNSEGRTVEEWLTMFHLVIMVLDPYTNESSWILPTVSRIEKVFEQADCRLALLVAADERDCRRFLGPMFDRMLTFPDPDRTAIKAFGLERLPAIVHLTHDGTIVNSAEGWKPREWRTVTDHLARIMSWTAPTIPMPSDPGPFEGSPALV